MTTRIFLIVQALIFFALGVSALTDPVAFTGSFGVEVSGRHGAYEMRGIFGGVSLAAGCLFLAGVFSRKLAFSALIFLLVYTAGYVFARIVGIYFDGVPAAYYWAFFSYELVSAVICFVLLRPKNAYLQS